MTTSKHTKDLYVPTEENQLLEQALEAINLNDEIKTLWRVVNVNAIDRRNMTDHGPVHFQIVANIALRLTRILADHDLEMSVTKDFGLSSDHAELIVFLASAFHDIGMSIDRKGHEGYSLFLTKGFLDEILTFLPTEERVIITAETLHAVISHRRVGNPQTLEAGIVRVADALDMSKGRSRIPYEAGKVDIHSVSAAAIEDVEISEGDDTEINILIRMNNSAGLFQVDELLKEKLVGSGLEPYIAITAQIEGETEKKLIKKFVVEA